MSTETHLITVHGLNVVVVRKAIKNLHLGVYPPNGRVRVAAPLAVSNDAVRLAIVGKLGWIKRQRAKFKAQPRLSEREMVSGESHYYLGRRYRLRIVERRGTGKVLLYNSALELHVQQNISSAQR
jgi:predicted metal-dependent hydrolase